MSSSAAGGGTAATVAGSFFNQGHHQLAISGVRQSPSGCPDHLGFFLQRGRFGQRFLLAQEFLLELLDPIAPVLTAAANVPLRSTH
jgi:hypothetical protein